MGPLESLRDVLAVSRRATVADRVFNVLAAGPVQAVYQVAEG
jgi:hypothetical protein